MDEDVESMEAAKSAFAVAVAGAGFAVLGVGDDVGRALQEGGHCFSREPPRLDQGGGRVAGGSPQRNEGLRTPPSPFKTPNRRRWPRPDRSRSEALVSPATRHSVVPWHNTRLAVDVDGDNAVAPIDALLVINYINSHTSDQVPLGAQAGPPYCDVDNDLFIAPKDALQVINYINARSSQSPPAGEGEAASPLADAELLWLLALDVSTQPKRRP